MALFPGSWAEQADCRKWPPAMWVDPFNEDPALAEERYATLGLVCSTCPVRQACSDWITTEDTDPLPHAFAAGRTYEERLAARHHLTYQPSIFHGGNDD